MNTYIKPEFVLASLRASALGVTSCAVVLSETEKETFDLLYPGLDWRKNGFHQTESCGVPIDGYCKIEAVSVTGVSQVLSS